MGFRIPGWKPLALALQEKAEEQPEEDPLFQIKQLAIDYDELVARRAGYLELHRETIEQLREYDDGLDRLKKAITAAVHASHDCRTRDGQFVLHSGKHSVFKVKPQRERRIDADALLRDHRPTLAKLGAIVHVPKHDEVDTGRIDKAVYGKQLPEDFLAPYVTRGDAKTPSVLIGVPEPEQEE